ncbi:Tetratricopeptide repeat protein [Rubripirellula tenax]|uniref:Tetratricopeptide repeat protein n=1 Tax=Rubripirellula tenax TaxID=2528015 RepID=A0A5C6E8Z3_9BACT|nr:hypothetical protein [Rubripirellula tenax]TWU46123.1 Tetratricopeptide repeat protein [Rubripirellula tenax]
MTRTKLSDLNAAAFLRAASVAVMLMGICCCSDPGWCDVVTEIESGGSLGATPDTPDSTLAELLRQASQSIAAGNVDAAIEQLKPLATNPEVSDVDVVMADMFFAAGRQREGLQWLEQATARNPKRMAIYLSFCEIAVRQKRWFDGWNLSQTGSRIKAPEHWSDALTRRVKRRLTFLLAVCNEGRSDWSGARGAYESLVADIGNDSDSSRREVLVGLARACVQLGDGEAAFAALAILHEHDPRLSPPRQLLAQMYAQNGMIDQADQTYQLNLSEVGVDADANAKLAYASFLLYNNEPQKAEPLLAESDSTDQQNDRIILQAVLARMQGRREDARLLFSKIHRDHPESIDAANHLAAILVEEENEAMRARALQIAESTVRNAPKSADGWATLGWVQLRLGDTVTAETSLLQSLKLGKPSRDTLYFLGKLKRATGNPKDAEMFEQMFAASNGPNLFSAGE